MKQKHGKITEGQDIQIIAARGIGKPEVQEEWTLQARGDRIIEVDLLEQVNGKAIRTVLQKDPLKPWQKKSWRVGPTTNGE